MKVIELLNKIANKEEVPTYIKVKGSIFGVSCKFNGHDLDYQLDTLDDEKYYLSDYICKGGLSLNDEIEIIDEDNKIEPLDIYNCFELMGDSAIARARLDENFTNISDKINDIIKKINKLETK